MNQETTTLKINGLPLKINKEFFKNQPKNNLTVWEIGDLKLFFSYSEIVGFRTEKTGLKVCKNIWSKTTGKHLNTIDDGNKKGRLKYDEFKKELKKTLSEFKLT